MICCRLVEFEVVSQKLYWCLEVGSIESVIGAGIDDEPDRSAVALPAGYPPIVAALHHVAALDGWGPIVEFADQDQGGNGHVAFKSKARRIKSNRGTELILRYPLDRAAFDRC